MTKIISDPDFQRIKALETAFYSNVDQYKTILQNREFENNFKAIMEIVEAEYQPEPDNGGLTGILQSVFLCEKPFLKKPEICGFFDGDPMEPCLNYFTDEGSKAYNRLLDLIRRLGTIGMLDSFEVDSIIETLDHMVSEGDV